MLIRYIFLTALGLCAGGMVAAGYFAFITAIGIVTNYAERSHTARHMMRYEDALAVGATVGNAWWSLGFRINFGNVWINNIFLGVSGLCYGVFVGSLVIALAETIKVIPIFFRRAKITTGLAAIIIAFALGKSAGNIIFFLLDMAKQ